MEVRHTFRRRRSRDSGHAARKVQGHLRLPARRGSQRNGGV